MPRSSVEVDLSPSSRRWLDENNLTHRKRRGQYMTPRPVADALLDRVDLRPGMKVLDPGVGTGELLAAVADRQPDADLTGWDIDSGVLTAASELLPRARLRLRSALDAGASEGFDLVVGNPPYFQVPVTSELRRSFGDVISGRANVFALFFKVALDQLEAGGTLAFVVPPSMNSGAYFESLREHIVSRAAVTDLTILDGTDLFEGANTSAQLLVLKKGARSRSFVFERSDEEAGFRRVIFTRSPQQLAAGFERRRTLWQLGYEAITGSVVWNQHKRDLKAVSGPDTVPLVWSRDLKGGVLGLGAGSDQDRGGQVAGAKPRHIRGRPSLVGPALLVNRVVGAVGRGELRTGLVPEGRSFVAENHVNVVRPRGETEQRIGWRALQAAIGEPGTGGRARMLTGNTQISATELTHLLPLSR